MSTAPDLLGLIREHSFREVSPGVQALSDEILARHGSSVQALLFYGSCLRRGDDEGLVDLYALVDSYRSAYRGGVQALLNKLLPPNVFYLEMPLDGRVVRAKYAVVSLADFQRGTSMRWFHSYFWGRFAQPTGLVYACDDQVADQVLGACSQAVVTFATRVLPRLGPAFGAGDLWREGLRLSYRSELRAERPHRVIRLFDDAEEYYEQLTRAAMNAVPCPVQTAEGPGSTRYHVRFSSWTRLCSRIGWGVRSLQGKILSVLRLLKGLLTFDGGLDYVLWKIERHSGVRVEVTPRLRRHPLAAMFVLSWRLYRRGAFR